MIAIRCYSCSTEKVETDFHKNKRNKSGRQSRCKDCDKKWHSDRYKRDKEKILKQSAIWRSLNKDKAEAKGKEWKSKNPEKAKRYQRTTNLRRSYGLEIQEYEEMLSAQNGKCAICGKHETFIHHKTKEVSTLAIDHCHKTGKIRALLCRSCNMALGHFGDSISLMKTAIAYLEKHNGN